MPRVKRDQFGSLFDHYTFERSLSMNNALAAVPRVENKKKLWGPSGVQVQENNEEYSILIDVPGVRAKDMAMQIVDNKRALYLRGVRTFESGETVEEKKFDRHINIAQDVNVDKIKADLTNGVLQIKAPKKENPERSNADFIPIAQAVPSA